MTSRGVDNSNELRNITLMSMVPRTTGGGMATIVIPFNQHHVEKGTITASWHNFYKSMNHAEELQPTWHTEGGRLHGKHHMTPLGEQ